MQVVDFKELAIMIKFLANKQKAMYLLSFFPIPTGFSTGFPQELWIKIMNGWNKLDSYKPSRAQQERGRDSHAS
jgi:hypothetical protein